MSTEIIAVSFFIKIGTVTTEALTLKKRISLMTETNRWWSVSFPEYAKNPADFFTAPFLVDAERLKLIFEKCSRLQLILVFLGKTIIIPFL